MDRIIKQTVMPLAETRGYFYTDDTFLRVVNDVLQGFHFRQRKAKDIMQFELYFQVLPMCKADERVFDATKPFDKVAFEGRRIGDLCPQLAWFPFAYRKSDAEGAARCAEMICSALKEHIFPFLDDCSSCAEVYARYPQYRWFSNMFSVWAYFALKAGDRQEALKTFQDCIAQREDALASNAKYFSEEIMEQKYQRAEKWDERDRQMIAFISNATEEELSKYLSENEQRSRAALEQILRRPVI